MSARYIGGLVHNPPGGWSGYFDGTGDYLTTPTGQTALTLGTSDFTIEMWAYPTTQVRGNPALFTSDPGAGLANTILVQFIGTTGQTILWVNNTNLTASSTTNYIRLNQWNHIAICRSGGSTYTFYINGVAVNSVATNSTSLTTNSWYIGYWTVADNAYTGYLSNFRIVKGTVVYTSNFTPPSGALLPITNTSLLTCAYPTFRDGSTNNFTITASGNTAVNTANPFPTSVLPNPALGNAGNGIYTMSQYASLLGAGTWPAIDPYYENVTLNLHGNGTNAAQNNTFLDSSTNNFTITRTGNTTQGTFTPYGPNWSNYFDGTGDDLRISTNAAFAIGTGDFTFEAWINPPSWATAAPFFVCTGTGGLWIGKNGSNFVVRAYGVADQLQYATMPTTNAWTHIVAVRSGTTLSLFYNGTRVATTTNSYSFAQQPVAIGSDGEPSAPTYYTGYISNLRLVKGTAVYDPTASTLTVPTAPLTAITNTSLLTCADNRFIDESTNNFTITRNGDVSVQRFSPFSPTTAYSTSVIGGSGYFDGSGDRLSIPGNNAFDVSSGNFTVEGWVYPTSNANVQGLFVLFTATNVNYGGMTLYVSRNTNSTITFECASPSIGGGSPAVAITTTNTVPINAWSHVSGTRSGNTFTVWINGVSSGTATFSGTLYWSPPNLYLGSGNDSTANRFTGYISSFRLVKGTAVYTSAFTPPSSPVTAISGTQVLTDFTNAGILDNAMMNDLETVGNAQLSTSVKKYGSASIYCDGSGDYVVQPTNVSYGYGTGDFTIEFWLYLNNTGLQTIFSNLSSASSTNPHLYLDTTLRYYTANADRITGSTLSTGIWYHIALCRASGSTRLFINGTQSGSTYADSNNYGTSAPLGIGTYWASGSPFTTLTLNGYIDDLRITKGVARYTTSFTPPTSQVQDQ